MQTFNTLILALSLSFNFAASPEARNLRRQRKAPISQVNEGCFRTISVICRDRNVRASQSSR